jgi:hypothetical protein
VVWISCIVASKYVESVCVFFVSKTLRADCQKEGIRIPSRYVMAKGSAKRREKARFNTLQQSALLLSLSIFFSVGITNVFAPKTLLPHKSIAAAQRRIAAPEGSCLACIDIVRAPLNISTAPELW